MVVIEPTPIEEDETHSNTAAKIKSETNPSSLSSTGDANDGFETASDSDLNGDDGHSDEQKLEKHLEEEESKQKVVAEANGAKSEGNRLFGGGRYDEALSKYEVALQVALDTTSAVEIHSACHANRALCFLKLGKYEDSIKESTKALELNPNYVKALLRRGEAHEKLEHFEEAIADLKKVLELDQSDLQTRKTIQRLEPLAAEKREKMKEEMIGKLKEMGNSILGRFGMSTDNFKTVQDPKTGSYSVQFQRKLWMKFR